MEKIKQRFSRNSALENAISEREPDEEESILADDSDAFKQSVQPDSDITLSLRLKLSESSNNITDEQDSDTTASNEKICSIDEEGAFVFDGQAAGQTVFEIISTETVKDSHSSFVIYRILLTKLSVVDENPCVVEKRYSEFEKLHSDLKKSFYKLMEHISFPKKRIVGNFTPKTIAKRSRAFEQYLSHLYSIDEIRFSQTFLQFFYLTDLELAHKQILQANYKEAIQLLQNVLPVQERIIGYLNSEVGSTLCALVACCNVTRKEKLGLRYGEAAMKCFLGYEDSIYYLPLLQTCIQLCWKLGKNKLDLEKLVSKRKRDSRELPSLLSVILDSAGVS